MISIKNKNIRLQVSKTILNEILNSNRFHIELVASKYWIKELIDINLIDNKLIKTLKTIETITISNGLHPELPIYKYNCLRYFISENTDKFIFQLGDKLY